MYFERKEGVRQKYLCNFSIVPVNYNQARLLLRKVSYSAKFGYICENLAKLLSESALRFHIELVLRLEIIRWGETSDVSWQEKNVWELMYRKVRFTEKMLDDFNISLASYWVVRWHSWRYNVSDRGNRLRIVCRSDRLVGLGSTVVAGGLIGNGSLVVLIWVRVASLFEKTVHCWDCNFFWSVVIRVRCYCISCVGADGWTCFRVNRWRMYMGWWNVGKSEVPALVMNPGLYQFQEKMFETALTGWRLSGQPSTNKDTTAIIRGMNVEHFPKISILSFLTSYPGFELLLRYNFFAYW